MLFLWGQRYDFWLDIARLTVGINGRNILCDDTIKAITREIDFPDAAPSAFTTPNTLNTDRFIGSSFGEFIDERTDLIGIPFIDECFVGFPIDRTLDDVPVRLIPFPGKLN